MESTQETTNGGNKNISIIILIVLVLVGFTAYSLMKNKDMNTTQQVLDTDRIAQVGDVIVINYSGKLENGTEFDSSYVRGKPFVFQVGVGQVIKGWDEDLIGVKQGEKRQLVITPERGYGAEDIKNPETGEVVIPANSTLIFNVEIVQVVSQAEAERMIAEQQDAIGAMEETSSESPASE